MHPDSTKIKAVTTWLALGKMPLVAGVVGVPLATLRQWRMQPWWGDMVRDIQSEDRLELDSKLKKIVERTLTVVEDRVENGDFQFNSRTGNVERVPVKLRDIHKVAVDLIDRRQALAKSEVEQIEQTAIEDVLKKLAGQFAQWVKPVRTIEGEVVAVHEEREEGLQEGVRSVPLETGTTTQPVGTEQSPLSDGKESGPQHKRRRGSQKAAEAGRVEQPVESTDSVPVSEPVGSPNQIG